jgi:hypothetical protein
VKLHATNPEAVINFAILKEHRGRYQYSMDVRVLFKNNFFSFTDFFLKKRQVFLYHKFLIYFSNSIKQFLSFKKSYITKRSLVAKKINFERLSYQ